MGCAISLTQFATQKAARDPGQCDANDKGKSGRMKQLSHCNRRRVFWVLVGLLAFRAAGAIAATDDMGDPVNGHKIATAWCANSHALAGSTQATATGAPSFSAIAANHAITPLSLRAFLRTPHHRMPDLHLSNTEMDDLISYILAPRNK
jgi:mono/diheme cytochrome c family protein